MISFFDWFMTCVSARTPWVVMGKGPSFSRHKLLPPDAIGNNFTMGLNHVCRERNVFVTHAIDLQVIDEIENLENRTDFLVMPWHPHIDFRATGETLADIVDRHSVLAKFYGDRRLLWYNLSSWPKEPQYGSPVVKVHHFSAEAAIRMLAMCGVRTIRTLGIDGGDKYAEEFKDIRPFRGGHSSFSIQQHDIDDVVSSYNLDLKRL